MSRRKHRETGGVNDAAKDLSEKPKNYGASSNVSQEAEERKRGGKAKKHVEMHGSMSMRHAGRKPRRSGGSCESDPYSAARKGDRPDGRTVMSID